MALIITSLTLPHDLNAINNQKHETTEKTRIKKCLIELFITSLPQVDS